MNIGKICVVTFSLNADLSAAFKISVFVVRSWVIVENWKIDKLGEVEHNRTAVKYEVVSFAFFTWLRFSSVPRSWKMNKLDRLSKSIYNSHDDIFAFVCKTPT